MSSLLQSTWLQVVTAALYYIPSILLEAFYIGAGFGLYLNRRTQLEAWDVELAFRRLRERLGGALLVASSHWAWRCRRNARRWPHRRKPPRRPCPKRWAIAMSIPTLSRSPSKRSRRTRCCNPVERRTMWVPRDKQRKVNPNAGPIAMFIASMVAGIVKYALWILAGLLIGVFAVDVPQPGGRGCDRWRRSATSSPRRSTPRRSTTTKPCPTMSPPLRGRCGARPCAPRTRAAVSARASTAWSSAPARRSCPARRKPNACVRRARFGAAEDRDAFARVVRTWQYAAYADRMPAHDEFESLLSLASARFGWAA
jgi:hypothetical protein